MGVILPNEGWTVSTGTKTLAPTLSVYRVTVGASGAYSVSWVAAAEGQTLLRGILEAEMQELEGFVAALPDSSAWKSSLVIYVFADGDLQSNFVDSEVGGPGDTMARLVSEGRRRLPAAPWIDATTSTQQP